MVARLGFWATWGILGTVGVAGRTIVGIVLAPSSSVRSPILKPFRQRVRAEITHSQIPFIVSILANGCLPETGGLRLLKPALDQQAGLPVSWSWQFED